jgi:hypothetical protein
VAWSVCARARAAPAGIPRGQTVYLCLSPLYLQETLECVRGYAEESGALINADDDVYGCRFAWKINNINSVISCITRGGDSEMADVLRALEL